MIIKRKEIKTVEVWEHTCDNCHKEIDTTNSVKLDTSHTDGYDWYGDDNLEFCTLDCMETYKYLGLGSDDDTIKLTLRMSVKDFKKLYKV